MRILFLCAIAPLAPTSGAVIQTYHFMRLLGQTHAVGLWAVSSKVHAAEDFGPLGSRLAYRRFVSLPEGRQLRRRWAWLSGSNPMARWGYYGPELEKSLRMAVREFRPDIVQCEHLHIAHLLLGLSHERCPPLLVFNAHDAVYVVLERSRAPRTATSRLGYVLDSRFIGAVKRMEAKVVRKVDLVCCVSEADAEGLRLHNDAKRFAVTPNGVDIEHFSALPEAPDADSPVLVFAGSMNYAPNADAIEYYVQNMHEPLRREFPRLKLLVVGAVTEPLRRFESVPGVQFVGFQSDIRTYFQQAHVNIVPLRAGSGTRFKILESWAMGRPVVSTTVGAEGLPFRDGDNILVADSSSDFCSRIGLLLRDPGIRRRLAEAGRRVVQEQFSWQTIVAHLDGQLTRLRDERSDGFRATGQNS